MKLFNGIVLILSVLIIACMKQPEKNRVQSEQVRKEKSEKGLALLNQNCFGCHYPETGEGNRVAPPINMVRRHYMDDKISREEFINKIVSFASRPSEDKSLLHGAVMRFGLMPQRDFKIEDLEQIAEYLYDHDVSTPEWLATWKTFKAQANSATPMEALQ